MIFKHKPASGIRTVLPLMFLIITCVMKEVGMIVV